MSNMMKKAARDYHFFTQLCMNIQCSSNMAVVGSGSWKEGRFMLNFLTLSGVDANREVCS